MSEKRVRDLIDQLPDDKQRLDMYIKIGRNYYMSQLNAEASKTLNVTVNFLDAIKTYKDNSKS